MDYEKAYNEALEQAKKELATYGSMDCDAARLIFRLFPQFRESEGERVRKVLINIVKGACSKYGIKYRGDEITEEILLSYLEKQKERGTEEWSEVELTFRGEKVKVKRQFFRDDKGREYSTTEQDEDAAWYALRAWCEKKGISMYDLYPRKEWSEEDEKMRLACIDIIEHFPIPSGTVVYGPWGDCINWLKSLKNRRNSSESNTNSPWKPSEEQMDSLCQTIIQTKGYSYSMYLPELYEQLKKL